MTDTNTAAALSAEADGWIQWQGGENPVGDQVVEVEFQLGGYAIASSEDLRWFYDGGGYDITAYRVATPAPAALEGLSSGEGEGVAKPLDWRKPSKRDRDEGGRDSALWIAPGFGGEYAIQADLKNFILWRIDDPYAFDTFPTVEAAKAHAEADWQKTIGRKLAALQPSSAADAEPVACSDEALEIANANHEKFERLWYLEKDKVDRLKLAVCGGEDVPGAIEAVSVDDCEGFIAEERSRHNETEDRLHKALLEVRESIKTYPLDDTATCMCGSPVEGHNVGSGHAPVSQADHAISLIVESINKALGLAANPDDALMGAGRPDDYEGPDVGMHDTEIVDDESDNPHETEGAAK